MVTIKDGCGCDPCDCDWKQKLKEAYSRAIQSVNKIGDNDGSIYYPDGTGFVKLPIPRLSEIQLIHTNKDNIDQLKVEDIRLQANIDAEKTARIAKDENLDSDISRIDATDTEQEQKIQDNADFKKGYQTGETKRSVGLEITDGGMTAESGPTTEYSPYLEYGTRFMDAQPFVKPALDEQEAKFQADMKKLVK